MSLIIKSISKYSLTLSLLFLGHIILSKNSHLVEIHPQIVSETLSEYDLNYFKITLFNNSKTDSLIIPRYNNCLELNGKLERFNGKFIYYNKFINYNWVKIEHPKFETKIDTINKVFINEDSIDVMNKRHHILIHKTAVQMEKSENSDYDYMFWSEGNPIGGHYIRNQFAIVFKDSLTPDSIENIGKENNLSLRCITYDKKSAVFYLNEGELKLGKNKILQKFLLDTNLTKDIGVFIDTTNFSYISILTRVNALTIKEIEKRKLAPV